MAMDSSLPLGQADYDHFGVDLNTSLLFDRHGNVCGCPQLWGLFTDQQNMELSLPAQFLDHLSSGCPHAGTTSHQRHVPLPLGAATEFATNTTLSTYTHTPRLHSMSNAEPRARPSRVLKQTCIFWYHGNCRHGAECPFEHELNHNWPIFRPHGYSHQGYRRCDLRFCPFRTDLGEFMQRYYPDGPRVDEIPKELDVKQKEAKQTYVTLGDENFQIDGDETSEGWIGFDSEPNSNKKTKDAPSDGSVDITSARSSDTAKNQAPSVQYLPLGPPQAVNLEHLSSQPQHTDTESTALKSGLVSTSEPSNEDHPDGHLEVYPGPQKKYKKTCEGGRALKSGSPRQPDQTIIQHDREQPGIDSAVDHSENTNRQEQLSSHAGHLDTEASNNKHHGAAATSAPADGDNPDPRLEVVAEPPKKERMRGKNRSGKRQRQRLRKAAEAQKMKSAPQEKAPISLSTASPSATVISNVPVVSQPANTATVATSTSPLTAPTRGPSRTSLPPTSISHAGTQGGKRKASSQGNSVPTKRQHLEAAEQYMLPKTHDLARKPEVSPYPLQTSVGSATTRELKQKLSIPDDDTQATMYYSKRLATVREASKTMYHSKKWIQDFCVDTEKALIQQEHGLAVPLVERITFQQPADTSTVPCDSAILSSPDAPLKTPRVPLADRSTYQHEGPKMGPHGGASRTHPQAQHAPPQAPPERPGICFF
ncbi:hypothetical protein PMIN03_001166 [Paraphaeosphaeria minitans]